MTAAALPFSEEGWREALCIVRAVMAFVPCPQIRPPNPGEGGGATAGERLGGIYWEEEGDF
jgi:hypothetical protein